MKRPENTRQQNPAQQQLLELAPAPFPGALHFKEPIIYKSTKEWVKIRGRRMKIDTMNYGCVFPRQRWIKIGSGRVMIRGTPTTIKIDFRRYRNAKRKIQYELAYRIGFVRLTILPEGVSKYSKTLASDSPHNSKSWSWKNYLRTSDGYLDMAVPVRENKATAMHIRVFGVHPDHRFGSYSDISSDGGSGLGGT
ncbi:hypothetical protein LTR27_002466 [Elasticomyces elasticus]|nr:hypothetical protein LTR27_002466 [Elasticomyces elasticus]